MIEINIINKFEYNGQWLVTYKYWTKGECACTGIKVKRAFDNDPTTQDLIESI